jgi:hypothetical protein
MRWQDKFQTGTEYFAWVTGGGFSDENCPSSDMEGIG